KILASNFPGKVRVTPKKLDLAAGTTSTATVNYQLANKASAGSHPFHIVARDATNNLQSFALGKLRLGQNNAEPVSLPIPLDIYEHNQPYSAYEPSFPRENQIYFDAD